MYNYDYYILQRKHGIIKDDILSDFSEHVDMNIYGIPPLAQSALEFLV